jgi:hypothetical protein
VGDKTSINPYDSEHEFAPSLGDWLRFVRLGAWGDPLVAATNARLDELCDDIVVGIHLENAAERAIGLVNDLDGAAIVELPDGTEMRADLIVELLHLDQQGRDRQDRGE